MFAWTAALQIPETLLGGKDWPIIPFIPFTGKVLKEGFGQYLQNNSMTGRYYVTYQRGYYCFSPGWSQAYVTWDKSVGIPTALG